MSDTKKGLVYKLSQKCLDQEEEINNLKHNVSELQEVVEKKQTKINKLKAELKMEKAKDRYIKSLNSIDLRDYNQKEKRFFDILLKELKTN